MADAYDILGLPQNASVNEVKKAYHALAKRWHPDRFPEGPERMWAEQKMISINIAYNEALEQSGGGIDLSAVDGADTQFSDARELLEIGQISAARKALMRIDARNAEWNYLFGWTLMQLSDLDKALIYLSVAVHQNPRSAKYARALREAQRLATGSRLGMLLRKR